MTVTSAAVNIQFIIAFILQAIGIILGFVAYKVFRSGDGSKTKLSVILISLAIALIITGLVIQKI